MSVAKAVLWFTRWLAARQGYALVYIRETPRANPLKGPFPPRVIDGVVHPGLGPQQ